MAREDSSAGEVDFIWHSWKDYLKGLEADWQLYLDKKTDFGHAFSRGARRRGAGGFEEQSIAIEVMGFKYRKSVLEELARHGIVPREDSPPDLIRDYVNGLYLVEIRSLRAKMRAGQIQKKDYARLVAELRDRYPILSLRVDLWAEERDE